MGSPTVVYIAVDQYQSIDRSAGDTSKLKTHVLQRRINLYEDIAQTGIVREYGALVGSGLS